MEEKRSHARQFAMIQTEVLHSSIIKHAAGQRRADRNRPREDDAGLVWPLMLTDVSTREYNSCRDRSRGSCSTRTHNSQARSPSGDRNLCGGRSGRQTADPQSHGRKPRRMQNGPGQSCHQYGHHQIRPQYAHLLVHPRYVHLRIHHPCGRHRIRLHHHVQRPWHRSLP
jgi:hypothetical protein